jgi:hypothetical protein
VVFDNLLAHLVARYAWSWSRGYAFGDEPSWASFANHSLELWKKVPCLLSGMLVESLHDGKELARNSADYAVELTDRRMESADVPAPNEVRAANDSETL